MAFIVVFGLFCLYRCAKSKGVEENCQGIIFLATYITYLCTRTLWENRVCFDNKKSIEIHTVTQFISCYILENLAN